MMLFIGVIFEAVKTFFNHFGDCLTRRPSCLKLKKKEHLSNVLVDKIISL